MTCPIEEDNTTRLMQWKCYELVIHGKTRIGSCGCSIKKTHQGVFLVYLRPKQRKFIVHDYVARFQEEQYQICLDTFLETFSDVSC